MKIENPDAVSTTSTFFVRGDLSLEAARKLLQETKIRSESPEQVPVIPISADIDPKNARRLRRIITASNTR
jgi:hypothetical protein